MYCRLKCTLIWFWSGNFTQAIYVHCKICVFCTMQSIDKNIHKKVKCLFYSSINKYWKGVVADVVFLVSKNFLHHVNGYFHNSKKDYVVYEGFVNTKRFSHWKSYLVHVAHMLYHSVDEKNMQPQWVRAAKNARSCWQCK